MSRRASPYGWAGLGRYPVPYGRSGTQDAGKHLGVIADPGLRARASLAIPVNGHNTIADGQTLTLTDNDPLGAATVTFEFDKVPDGVGGGNVAVDISAAGDETAVRDALVAAINGAAMRLTATPTGTTGIQLDQADPGASGNTAVAEGGLGASLSPTAFAGGADPTDLAPSRIGPRGSYL